MMSDYATPAERQFRDTCLLVHALNVASCVVGVTALVAVIIAHVKRGEMAGTIWEGHLTYAIRTFWIGLLVSIIGAVLTLVGIGIVIMLLVALWFLVRSIVALLKAMDRRPIPDPNTLFI